MSKSFISRFFVVGILLFFSFGFSVNALAQTASAVDSINAEILSNVWFSATIINEGDTINIYAGFQNHSEKSLSGTAGFYVDNLEIKKVDFTASPKSLIKLETKYTAVAGNHQAQIKILNIDNLLASETEKKDFSVIKSQITQEAVLEKVTNLANTVVNTGNQYADTLANYVESFKTPTENSPDSAKQDLSDTTLSLDQNKIQGQVLGASTENIPAPATKNILQKLSFYNPLFDLVAFLIHQWIWVLAVILLFILYLIFT